MSNITPGSPHQLAEDLRAVLGRLKRRLREQVPAGDLSLSQRSVLHQLDREGPATVTTLARAEGMRPQSMGAIVAALQAAGMLEGRPDPGDGRQTLFSLTAASREWIAASRAARRDWLIQALQERLSAQERAQIEGAVALLRRLAGP
jgi:DNA-binding MarR family transcriptional regulator